MPQDFYQILGVGYNASTKTIQKAFHNLAKELHPDKNPQDSHAEERFKLVSEAYETLSHPVKKNKYDLKLRYGINPHIAQPPSRKRPYVRPGMYRKVRPVFTKKAHLLGGVSILVIIMVVAFATVFITRYNSQYNFQRGLSNFQNQRYSAAYFNLKQSLGPFNPYQAAAHLLMADICFREQANWTLTMDHVNKAYDAEPSDSIRARLMFLQGKIEYQKENYKTAYSWFEQATELHPALDSAYYQMGEIDTFILGRYRKALGHYQLLTEHNPHLYDPYLRSAYCYYQLGQYQDAIEVIDRSLVIKNDVGMAYYLKAISAQALNWQEIACNNFVQAHNLGLSAAVENLQSYCNISLEGP